MNASLSVLVSFFSLFSDPREAIVLPDDQDMRGISQHHKVVYGVSILQVNVRPLASLRLYITAISESEMDERGERNATGICCNDSRHAMQTSAKIGCAGKAPQHRCR